MDVTGTPYNTTWRHKPNTYCATDTHGLQHFVPIIIFHNNSSSNLTKHGLVHSGVMPCTIMFNIELNNWCNSKNRYCLYKYINWKQTRIIIEINYFFHFLNCLQWWNTCFCTVILTNMDSKNIENLTLKYFIVTVKKSNSLARFLNRYNYEL